MLITLYPYMCLLINVTSVFNKLQVISRDEIKRNDVHEKVKVKCCSHHHNKNVGPKVNLLQQSPFLLDKQIALRNLQ